MLTHIKLTNYCSFLDAKVELSPVTLVIGANGSGKSNFLRAIAGIEGNGTLGDKILISAKGSFPSHFNYQGKPVDISMDTQGGAISCSSEHTKDNGLSCNISNARKDFQFSSRLFCPNPSVISESEAVISRTEVAANGSGTTQVLHDMKNGAREESFIELKKKLSDYIPEIQNLSFTFPNSGEVAWQVTEKGVSHSVSGEKLSEGTRIVVFLLAVLYQETPPDVILLEDIDHGMHPRLFEKLISLFKRMSEYHGVQIIATTHNPYLVSCFEDDLKAVVVVEKENGNSTLCTLEDAVEGLEYDPHDPESLPLGELWFSGYVGGVPSANTAKI